MFLQPDDHVLFYGDSITDAGRQAPGDDGSGLGTGYAMFCAAWLGALYPDYNIKFTNRGISGNRVGDLESRLDTDVLALKPSLVSILIGINDTWRAFDSGIVSSPDEYRESYRRVVSKIKDSGARVVICEPFLLPIPDDRRAWREDLGRRIAIGRDISREFGALYLPLDGIFASAACRQSLAYWMPDGVHPTPAGHALIAQHWIDLVSE